MISFSHIGLVVTDLKRSVDFYTKVLGLEVVEQHPDTGRGLSIAFLGVTGRGIVELLCYTDEIKKARPERGRYDHLAFSVDDLRQTMAHVVGCGVAFEQPEPIVVLDGRQIAFFHGPDGERVELVQPAK